MGAKIVTAISAFNTPVDPQGTEGQSANVIFNSQSTSVTSHTIDVSETPILVRAYGLPSAHTITVNMVGNDGITTVTQALILHSKTVQLSSNNTALIIDMPGRYNFHLDSGGDLGTVSCTYMETGLSFWSWGLKDFANAT